MLKHCLRGIHARLRWPVTQGDISKEWPLIVNNRCIALGTTFHFMCIKYPWEEDCWASPHLADTPTSMGHVAFLGTKECLLLFES